MNTDLNKNDRQLHENLHLLAGRLALPAEPTELQEAAWKQASASERTAPGAGAQRRNRRVFAFLGAGSLLAASVAIALTISGLGGEKRVEAAAIFDSLRDAVSHAFSLRLTNVVQDGIHVDGRLLFAVPSEDDDGEAEDYDAPDAMYIELHATADENAEADIAGLDADISFAAAAGNQWLFLKLTALPEEFQSNTVATWLAGIAANGVMFDLTGLDDLQSFHTASSATGDPADGEDSDEGEAPTRSISIGIGTGQPDQPSHEQMEHVHHGLHLAIGFDEESADHDAGGDNGDATDSSAHGELLSGEDLNELHELLRDMVTGRMTSEQMSTVVTHLEGAAQDVQVSDLGSGNHSLVARNFNLAPLGLSDDEEAEIAEIGLEIRYRQDTGIQWVELQNVGEANGAVRFELLPDGIDPALLDRARLTADGVIPTIPLASLANLFSGIHDDGDSSQDSNDGDD